jgi:dihydrolipoamide dehydrogenase
MMTAPAQYDAVVIGSGPGGYVAAIRLAQLGLKTACVEKRSTLGGTCLNVGCIPSKALLQSTEHLSWLKHSAKEHGITCTDVSLDFNQLMKRKEGVVQGLTQGVASLFKKNKIDQIQGMARFLSKDKIEVVNGDNKQEISAKYFILATGSEPIALPFLPFDEKTVVSSTGALSLSSIPKKMVVIGGGVIGVELASVYNRLGTDVTIVEMLDSICAGMEEAVSKSLLQILKKQGLNFYLSTKVIEAKKNGNGYVITIQPSQEQQKLELPADIVLVAIGRKPYSTGLGLQEIGVVQNKGLVVVDGNFRTSIPNIFAIGDLIDGPMLAHKASEEGVAAAEIIAGLQPSINYMAIPNVIYTNPEAASIGLTEKEAKALGKEVQVGTVFFRGNSRARCSGETDGFLKVIGLGKNGILVGMHVVGAQASELIDAGMVAIEKKTTLKEIANYPHAHPTLSEAFKEACGAALGIAIHG